MTFGGQTVTFVTVSRSSEPGYLGLQAETRTPVDVAGCRFRPLSSTESPETQTDVATAVWKCTAPPEAAALAATSTGELIVDGVPYRIDGQIMPKYDMAGFVEHVTIMAKRQAG